MAILVLGVGNLLMGDEGVGIHVVRHLQEQRDSLGIDSAIDLVDGGTGGFHLLGYFETHERIILVDAAIDDSAPGTVGVLHPRYSSDYPATLSAHDIGLKDLLDTAHLLDLSAKVTLITISVALPDVSMGLTLSDPVAAAVEPAAAEVVGQLRNDPKIG